MFRFVSLPHHPLSFSLVLRCFCDVPSFLSLQIVDTSLLSLECLPALRCVSLAHNRIERLAPGSFDACSELRELVLSDNTIRAVGGALVAATLLETLDASNNSIASMSEFYRYISREYS